MIIPRAYLKHLYSKHSKAPEDKAKDEPYHSFTKYILIDVGLFSRKILNLLADLLHVLEKNSGCQSVSSPRVNFWNNFFSLEMNLVNHFYFYIYPYRLLNCVN